MNREKEEAREQKKTVHRRKWGWFKRIIDYLKVVCNINLLPATWCVCVCVRVFVASFFRLPSLTLSLAHFAFASLSIAMHAAQTCRSQKFYIVPFRASATMSFV